MKVSADTISRLFANDPSILIFGFPETLHKRRREQCEYRFINNASTSVDLQQGAGQVSFPARGMIVFSGYSAAPKAGGDTAL